jgi:microsomal dipeptidase-like Zn-dependent dipeptidase
LVCAIGGVGCGDDAPAVPGGEGSSSSGTVNPTTSGGTTSEPETGGETEDLPEIELYDFAGGCYSVRSGEQALTREGEGFAFADGEGTPLRLKAADLGAYLLYDPEGGYVVEESGPLIRQTQLDSDVTLIDDTYVSGAIWQLERSDADPQRHQLRNLRTDTVMGTDAVLELVEASGCAEHPELSVDAEGAVTKATFDDGTLYGIVDTHSHILSNYAFGGGGIFHGGAFHPLGVEHALPDCSIYHGENGRRDFFGFAFDGAGADGADITSLLPAIAMGELAEDNHVTDGYPQFTEWPNAPTRSTHQTQYYKWLERAWMSGLRLVVQHATTNSIICHLTVGQEAQESRYDCEDMTAVDRIIDQTYAMERYIDAQSGGPGEGWFRVVTTPAQAREVIGEGKMAVILGIETSNLFECTVTPRPGFPTCDESYLLEQLDAYYERGVRVLFPVHKYDNAFSAGDGDRSFIEIGNLANSGHWSNFTNVDCPDVDVAFDEGPVNFGGLNMPRDDYFAKPPIDVSNFPNAPLSTLIGLLSNLNEPPLEGDYCQNYGLTPLGETLLSEMMKRGMIVEIDHFSRRSYEQAFNMLQANDYPAAGTHGTNNDGRLYELGGISKTGLGRCRSAEGPGAMTQRLKDRIAMIEAAGGYPAEGFGFDLNGFAGAPGPRFGEGVCDGMQEDPITYPFDSVAGDVTFSEPVVGERTLDFNTEGLVHIGLLPELLEDARRDAVSEDDLEPLFRSAEGYIRMWEKAEARSEALD